MRRVCPCPGTLPSRLSRPASEPQVCLSHLPRPGITRVPSLLTGLILDKSVCHVSQAGLELAMSLRITLNSRSPCSTCHVHCHSWLHNLLLKFGVWRSNSGTRVSEARALSTELVEGSFWKLPQIAEETGWVPWPWVTIHSHHPSDNPGWTSGLQGVSGYVWTPFWLSPLG